MYPLSIVCERKRKTIFFGHIHLFSSSASMMAVSGAIESWIAYTHNLLPSHPLAVSSRPFFDKLFFIYCCHKRFCQKDFYCFQHDTVIIRFSINFTDKGFPLFLHCYIVSKFYNLLTMFKRKTLFTIYKGLSDSLRQQHSIKIKFSCQREYI